MTSSIRGRLLMGTVAGAAVVLLGAGALLYGVLHAWLWREFDQALAARASTLASLIEEEDGELEFTPDYRTMTQYDRSPRADYFQIVRMDGSLVARSRSLKGASLGEVAPGTAFPALRDLRLPDGRAGRCVTVAASPRREHGSDRRPPLKLLVSLASSIGDLQATLFRIRALLAGVILLAIGLTSAILFTVVGRELRPLHRLAADIARLHPEDRSARIHLTPVPSELLPVVEQMNALLERTDAAFQREKSFTADVAHELRTPLAGLRSTLEVSRSRVREAQAYQADMAACLDITGHMQAMVDSLLRMARLDHDAVAVQAEPVDLDILLAECFKPLEGAARARKVRIQWPSTPAGTIISDREKLRQVFTNLLDNAVTYVDPGGQVVVEFRPASTGACWVIRNTGCTLSAEQVGKVFDRFWRGDTARQAAGQHCGLGLPLARMLVEKLGGTLRADVYEGWFRVSIAVG